MNSLIINRLKIKIEEANKNKKVFFNFEPSIKSEIANLKDITTRLIYKAKYTKERLKEEKEKLERLKLEEKKVLKFILEIEEELYSKTDFLSKIYIKNKKLYFFGIEIYLKDEFLIIKKDKGKRIYINLNQGSSIDYEGETITIKNNALEEHISISSKFQKKENINEENIHKNNKTEEYFQLFLDLIEIIIINKEQI